MGNQTELEYKFDARDVSSRTFCEKLIDENPNLYQERKTFNDVYYKRGAVVVRHRHARGGELTVKERKSADSIVDRVEINLLFSEETDREDVEAFLAATGYERLFTVQKHYVHIFEFLREDYEVEVCLYSCSRADLYGKSNYRKFIEIEIKRTPGSVLADDRLKLVLESWRQFIQLQFKLGEPLNESLLEIYSKLTSPSIADDGGIHYRI